MVMSHARLQHADAVRRKAAILGVAAAVTAWIGTHLVVAWLKSVPPTNATNLALLVVQPLGVASPILGFAVYLRASKTGRLVVWLRRFREAYGSRLRFHRCLARAAQALATPATLQDRSFRSSYTTALVRGWILWPLSLLGWIAGTFVGMLALLPLRLDSPAALLVVMAVWTVVWVAALAALVRRLGWRTFDTIAALERSLARLRSGRGIPFGVEVIRVADDLWRDAVTASFRRAQLAVVDITDPSDHVLWELGEAIDLLGPERVLLVRERDDDVSRAETVHDLDGRLDPAVSWPPRVTDCAALMIYPRRQAPVSSRTRQYKEVSETLRRAMARALA